jgi:hypothetical protein
MDPQGSELLGLFKYEIFVKDCKDTVWIKKDPIARGLGSVWLGGGYLCWVGVMQFGHFVADAIFLKTIVIGVFHHFPVYQEKERYSLVVCDRQQTAVAGHGSPLVGIRPYGIRAVNLRHIQVLFHEGMGRHAPKIAVGVGTSELVRWRDPIAHRTYCLIGEKEGSHFFLNSFSSR